MDLISREAAIHQTMGKLDYVDTIFDKPTESEIVYMLRSLPSVPAVPLEPLAKWLAERYEPPYSLDDINKLKIPIDFKQQKDIWRVALTKWMEEQDAAD